MRIKLNIKDTKVFDETSIIATFRWDGNESKTPLKINTGIRVKPRNWQGDKGKPFYKKIIPVSSPDNEMDNALLEQFIVNAKHVYSNFKFTNKREPNKQELNELLNFKQKLKKEANDKRLANTTLFDFFAVFIKEHPTRKNKRGDYLTNTTDYIKTLSILKQYEEHLRSKKEYSHIKTDFPFINMEWYDGFVDYCHDSRKKRDGTLGNRDSTIGKNIKNLKAVLNRAKIRKYNCNPYDYYNDEEFMVSQAEGDDIALDKNDLDLIYQLELPKGSSLDIARDYLLIGCLLGLRSKDYLALDNSNFQGEYIIKRTSKTKAVVAIKIHPWLRAIHTKYGNNLPPRMELKTFNRNVKKVCKLIPDFHKLITLEEKGPEGIIKVTKPKYQWVSSHTGRRTKATITHEHEAGVSLEDIGIVLGHSSVKETKKYLKIAPTATADKIYDKVYGDSEQESQLRIVS